MGPAMPYVNLVIFTNCLGLARCADLEYIERFVTPAVHVSVVKAQMRVEPMRLGVRWPENSIASFVGATSPGTIRGCRQLMGFAGSFRQYCESSPLIRASTAVPGPTFLRRNVIAASVGLLPPYTRGRSSKSSASSSGRTASRRLTKCKRSSRMADRAENEAAAADQMAGQITDVESIALTPRNVA